MKSRIEITQKGVDTDALLIENKVDLFYLTGLALSAGALVVTRYETVLFVDGRYFAKAERSAPCAVRLFVANAVADWLEAREVKTLTFDGAYTSYDRFMALKGQLKMVELKAASAVLKEMRAVKDGAEIGALKAAAALTHQGLKHVEGLLQEGISEEELAFEFELFVRKKGASRLSFDPIVAFGENSAYPHYRAGKERLKKNQIVLIDVGAVVDSYCGDLTRVVFFGEKDPQLEKMLELTKQAHAQAMHGAKPGVKFGDLDRAARAVFETNGVSEFFTHGLCHGVGLEVHEFPRTTIDKEVALETGMVFTIEPGLYRPGLGGVRWEDTVLVTKNGLEIL
jgi:Xaa-Pro aminopeptidase